MGVAETTIPSPDQEKPRGIPWAKSQENTTSIKSRAISSFWFWASRFQTTKLPHFRLLIFAMVLGIQISDSLPQAYTISVKCQVRRVAPRYKASRKRPSAKQWGREPTRAFLFFFTVCAWAQDNAQNPVPMSRGRQPTRGGAHIGYFNPISKPSSNKPNNQELHQAQHTNPNSQV